MNIELCLRRLLVLVTVVLVLAVVAWRVLLSQPSVTCMYFVILADFTLVKVPVPQGATAEQIEVEARRLHPETKNPTVIGDLTNRVPFPPAPDELVAPESCDATERAAARVARYAYAVAAGIVVAVPIAGVLWLAFFALRWVVRGFKSAA